MIARTWSFRFFEKWEIRVRFLPWHIKKILFPRKKIDSILKGHWVICFAWLGLFISLIKDDNWLGATG